MKKLHERLRTFRIYTKTRWGKIAQETGLSLKTLHRCEGGKVSEESAQKLEPFLDRMERESRRKMDINDRDGSMEFFVNNYWKSGTVESLYDRYYFTMEPVKVIYTDPEPCGAITLQDDSLEPTIPKGSLIVLRWTKYRHILYWERPYLIIDESYRVLVGRIYPSNSASMLYIKPDNASYSPIYIDLSLIRCMFQIINWTSRK